MEISLETNESQIIELCYKYDPIEFYKKIKSRKNEYPSGNEIFVLRTMANSQKIKNEVLNILIFYLLVELELNIVFNIVYHISAVWRNDGAETPEQVIELIKRNKDNATSTSSQREKEEL